jgi:hypothetical protein
VNPVKVLNTLTKVLAEGKGGTVRDRAKEASGKAMSRRKETAYKAQSPGKLAPHDETLDSGDRVNAAAVQRKFTFLSGEICLTRDEICLVRAPGADHRGTKVQAYPVAIAGYERTIDSNTSRVLIAPYRATCRVMRQKSADAIVVHSSNVTKG